jgi:hypothetical protein
MAVMPRGRMGLPPRSFAADAHGCIMVRVAPGAARSGPRLGTLASRDQRAGTPWPDQGAGERAGVPHCPSPTTGPSLTFNLSLTGSIR